METPVPQPIPEGPAQKNNGLAIAAGALGLGGLVVTALGLIVSLIIPAAVLTFPICCGLGILMGIVGLVLGIIALVQIKNHPDQKGKGLAITGIVLGVLAVISVCLVPILGTTLLALFGPAVGNIFSQITSNLTLTPMP